MKKKKRISIGSIVLNLFLICVSLTYILPLVLMLSISFSSETAITTYGYSLLPKEFSVAAYKECFANPYQILSAYKTTTAQAILGTFLAMLVQCLMAYPLSRPNYKFKKHVTIILFLTMLFGGGLVPSYIVNTKYLHRRYSESG